MSIYCISDIHGRFDEFMALLGKVDFNKEKDKLYILGDLVDWGNKSVEVIDYCMENKDCIEVILGNHDFMMMQFFKENPLYFETGEYNKYDNWIRNNSGDITLDQLKGIGKDRTNKILCWLKKLRYFIPKVKVNGRTFYLCHAYPYVDTGDVEKDKENCVWERVGEYENPLKSLGISETTTLVAGHTITSNYRSPEPGEHCKIFKNLHRQKIMIDCGAKALYNNKVYTLAMMRLDDLEEFYF